MSATNYIIDSSYICHIKFALLLLYITWSALLTDLMQERSAPEGGEGHQKWVGAPSVGYESGQASNQNDGEGLEQVSAPMGFVEALVKEINSEIPGADEVVIS